MKKTVGLTLLFALVATLAFAHAGEVHSYMGTITTLESGGNFLLKKTDGSTMRVHVAKTTVVLRADGHAAAASELKAGSRVVVKIARDGRTALSVRMAAPKTQ